MEERIKQLEVTIQALLTRIEALTKAPPAPANSDPGDDDDYDDQVEEIGRLESQVAALDSYLTASEMVFNEQQERIASLMEMGENYLELQRAFRNLLDEHVHVHEALEDAADALEDAEIRARAYELTTGDPELANTLLACDSLDSLDATYQRLVQVGTGPNGRRLNINNAPNGKANFRRDAHNSNRSLNYQSGVDVIGEDLISMVGALSS